MDNLVSIITPLYNSEDFIAETIDSVLAQSYTNWEMIIVDDISSDTSIKIVEAYIAKDNRIKLIKQEKNLGPAVARNRAIKEAKGKYIAFLDSDDYWDASKLEKQVTFMQENMLALSYTSYYRVDEEEGKIIDEQVAKKSINYHELLKQNSIGCLTAIYDREILGTRYMPEIIKRQDYALWLDILKEIPFSKGLEEPLAYYRVRNSSVSSNKLMASAYNWKVLREIEKLPLHKAIYYFACYMYRSILKYK